MRHEIVRYVKGIDWIDGQDVYLGVVVVIGPGQVGWAKALERARKHEKPTRFERARRQETAIQGERLL